MFGVILLIIFIIIAIAIPFIIYYGNFKYNPSKARSELLQIFKQIALINNCHQAAETAVKFVNNFKQKYPQWLQKNITNMAQDEMMQKAFIYANARLNINDCNYPLAMLLNN